MKKSTFPLKPFYRPANLGQILNIYKKNVFFLLVRHRQFIMHYYALLNMPRDIQNKSYFEWDSGIIMFFFLTSENKIMSVTDGK